MSRQDGYAGSLDLKNELPPAQVIRDSAGIFRQDPAVTLPFQELQRREDEDAPAFGGTDVIIDWQQPFSIWIDDGRMRVGPAIGGYGGGDTMEYNPSIHGKGEGDTMEYNPFIHGKGEGDTMELRPEHFMPHEVEDIELSPELEERLRKMIEDNSPGQPLVIKNDGTTDPAIIEAIRDAYERSKIEQGPYKLPEGGISDPAAGLEELISDGGTFEIEGTTAPEGPCPGELFEPVSEPPELEEEDIACPGCMADFC